MDTREKNAARSMINNLNSASKPVQKASEAKYLLRVLNTLTGEPQQQIIVNCVMYAVRNMPQYSLYYNVLHAEWEKLEKENKKTVEI